MNSFTDYSEYLMHYGVKGMHWGIRRYQPYPKGYKGTGSFQDLREKNEERRKKYVETHKKAILNSPTLLNRYYDYIDEKEIDKAKKKMRDKQELHKQTINAINRPNDFAKAFLGMAATAVALAGFTMSDYGKVLRSKIEPILSKTLSVSFNNKANTPKTFNQIKNMPISSLNNMKVSEFLQILEKSNIKGSK